MKTPTHNPFVLALKAHNLSVEIHKHSAYQIVISNESPFTSTINGKLCENIYGFLIKPQVKHHCIAKKGTITILNIEPYSAIGLELADRFKETDSIILGSVSEIGDFFQTETPNPDIQLILSALLSKTRPAAYDERVTKIVEFIKENSFRQDITPQTFADIVFLSPSRLAALFKQQTGSSLSKYLLWTRLRQSIYLTLSDKEKTLTEVAYDTGFYDLPQLNKYMYEMFGMPPKALKHNSDLIQVF